MKRLTAMVLVGGMLVAPVGGAEAKKKKKKKPPPPPVVEQVDVNFYLRSTGCSAADVNFDYLTLADADEAIECFYTGAGIRNEIGATNPTPATASRETATRYWDTVEGGPLVLDASKSITGKLWTAGGSCAVSLVPCSPVGLSVGEMILDIEVVGFAGGVEFPVGSQTATFNVVPGAPHLTEVDIAIDAALGGLKFDVIEIRTWQHGRSVGHGVMKTNGDTSSFITIPTLVG